MLIFGLVVAAMLGPLYVWLNVERQTVQRFAIGSGVAVLGAGVTPLAMGMCAFAEGTSGVDHLLALTLMWGAAWIALIALRSFFDRTDGKRWPGRSGPADIAWAGGFPGFCCRPP